MQWYVLAVIGFALCYDQRRVLVIENKQDVNLGPSPDLFSFVARFCGGACIAMLIAGFFIGLWYWPLVAMAIGTGTNLYGRLAVPDDWRWMASFVGAMIGVSATGIVIAAI